MTIRLGFAITCALLVAGCGGAQNEAPSPPAAAAPRAAEPAPPPPATEQPSSTARVAEPPAPATAIPGGDAPVGWAAAEGGTTGGQGGATVAVSDPESFLQAVQSKEPQIVHVSGTIRLLQAARIQSNKTIIGLGTDATISGGIRVAKASNVILRNLAFTEAPDAIEIEDAHHVWVDHCDLSNCADSLIDIKHASDFVTISWNRFRTHDKTTQVGHSDTPEARAEDTGHLRVTYHHNFFDGTETRNPQVRFAEPVHVFNNYFLRNEHGVIAVMNAGVLVEGNYFEDVGSPTETSLGSSPEPGRLVERDNLYDNCEKPPQASGTVAEIGAAYRYALDRAADVPALVRKGAGVIGKTLETPGAPASTTATAATKTPARPAPSAPPAARPAATPPTAGSSRPPASPMPAAVLDEVPIGWASVEGGTAGGRGGEVVTVSDVASFQKAIRREEPLVIQVSGTIHLDKAGRVAANKTLIGLGADATISDFGLRVVDVSNVIIRNLIFTGAPDAIGIEGAHHVWVDHCDLSHCVDGLVDVTRASDFVTVSWNHFHDHHKTTLVGHKDTPEIRALDTGHLRVTYHHNFFDGTESRHPRVRFGEPVHVFNNYYLNNEHGAHSSMDAGVLVEANYFERVRHPIDTEFGDSPEPGRLVERDNVYQDCEFPPQPRGTVKEIGDTYRYTLDKAADVPAIVRSGAGVGKIGKSVATR